MCTKKPRAKKYNPRRSFIMHQAELLPLITPLNDCKKLLQRGYLTSEECLMSGSFTPDNKGKLVQDKLPCEYSLLIFIHQHTFFAGAMVNHDTAKIIKKVRPLIEACFEKIKCNSVDGVLPDKVEFTAHQITEICHFIDWSIRALVNVTIQDYTRLCFQCTQDSQIYLSMKPDLAINIFIDHSNKSEVYELVEKLDKLYNRKQK